MRLKCVGVVANTLSGYRAMKCRWSAWKLEVELIALAIIVILATTNLWLISFHKIGAGNPLVTKCRWEECDCHALNCLTKLVIIF